MVASMKTVINLNIINHIEIPAIYEINIWLSIVKSFIVLK